MATYEREKTVEADALYLTEQHIYGSSRLGYTIRTDVNMDGTLPTNNHYLRYLGEKRYELSNHLGNVLVTMSDRRHSIQESTSGYTQYVEHYEPDVMTAQDYDPFGMLLVGRIFPATGSEGYRFGFNAQEQDDEVYGNGNLNTALFWEYDTRLGRRWNVDPVVKSYESSYLVFSGNPILFVDVKGDKKDWYKDESGTLQFDPNVQGKDDSNKVWGGPKGTYVGKTTQEKTEKGDAYYRRDGSIYFTNQTDAYKRIWDNSYTKGREREQMGIILKEGVLVTPDYKNKIDDASIYKYGYKFNNSNIQDPVSSGNYEVVATIHTHIVDLGPGSKGPGIEDISTFTSATPNRPFFVIAVDRKIYGKVGNIAGIAPIELPKKASTIEGLISGFDFQKLIITNINIK